MLKWEIAEYLSMPRLLAGIAMERRRGFAGMEIDCRWGAHPQQRYKLFMPPPCDSTPGIMIYFLHGGGWRQGSPEFFSFIGRYFARNGYPCLLGGYRLAPSHSHPVQLEDAFTALDAGLEALNKNNRVIKRVILGGQSAGAQLAGLMAFDQHRQRQHGLPAYPFAGLLLVSGPLDFSNQPSRLAQRFIADYMGSQDSWQTADPLRQVRRSGCVPALCVHGDCDPLVPIQNSLEYARRINSMHPGMARVLPIAGGHHSDLVDLFLGDSSDSQQMMDWLDRLAGYGD